MIARKAYYLRKTFGTRKFSKERLRDFQDRLLRDIVNHAYKNFSFYRSYWDGEGFKPEEFSGIEDLKRIPRIDSRDLRGSGGLLTEKMREGDASMISSGTSSREPTKIDFAEQAWDWLSAVYFRSMLVQGYRPFRNQSYYLHEGEENNPNNKGFLARWITPRDLVRKERDYREQLDRLGELDNQYIVYFPMVLFTLAKLYLQGDPSYDISPDIILTYGENLTPEMRETIEKAFDAEIYDNYASAEFGRIAVECPEGNGYHVQSDSVLVEVVDEEGDEVEEGEIGEVVVTGLVNEACPLIRYNQGDIAVKGGADRCECGTSFPRLKGIKGRKQNIVRNNEGERILPSQIIDVLARYNDLLLFQFAESDGEYIVRYIPNTGFSEDVLEEIRQDFADELRLTLSLEEADKIERTGRQTIPVMDLD
ncbi:MAG: phenylacetate--CoA ligase family protein [Candidatus Aenigmatarchaeota archaeon]